MAGDVSQGYRHVSAALIVLHFIREEMRSVTGRPQGVLSPLLSRVGGREGGGGLFMSRQNRLELEMSGRMEASLSRRSGMLLVRE